MTVDGETITGGAAIVEKISKFIGCTFEVQTVRFSLHCVYPFCST